MTNSVRSIVMEMLKRETARDRQRLIGQLTPEFGDPRLPDRFWDKAASDESGCWLWLACVTKPGYGQFRWNGKTHFAHRVSYGVLLSDLSDTLVLDHLCRVRNCVNPIHLEEVTTRENLLRGEGFTGEQSRRTHCPNGHPLTEDNLVPGLLALGHRSCKICGVVRTRKYTELYRLARAKVGLSYYPYFETYGWSPKVAERLISA